MTVVSVLVALLLLGILITVHEFGHYIFARMTGIEVMEFAIGFGPKIVGWTGKSGTKFALRCIPLGGYCAFYGEDDVEGKATNDPRAFGKQPVWKRMLSVLMGPGMNFLLPLVVLVLYFWIGGVTGTEALVADVEQGGPAYTAGLQAGDIILDVNGTAPNPENASQSLTELINASQGTNPSIDPLREPMETRVYLGSRPEGIRRDKDGKLIDDTPPQLKLEVPIMFSAMSYGSPCRSGRRCGTAGTCASTPRQSSGRRCAIWSRRARG